MASLKPLSGALHLQVSGDCRHNVPIRIGRLSPTIGRGLERSLPNLVVSRPMQVIAAMVAAKKDRGDVAIKKQSDRRQFGRRTVFKPAAVLLNDGRRMAGFIVDISDAGARIKLSKPGLIEPEFDLEIPGDDFIVRCKIVHVDDISVGVKYIKPPRRISWLKR